ncbi:protoporphyrinogen oxidase [Fodinibius sediminis]|uniref:Coproporphyrinogen III oxidase n=1 Tax=Fodinibius sediminis TaxID=1214077 RepID=A0A521C4S5_9BACT|nr:protoporphyrinogen oxidase [Fodinibius sediminis]SMO54409.1 oxygen-dependent protoporphyrinogen oxidase [Fodinibius sediminis]
MTKKKSPVGVIGAGISGLTTAYILQKKGITATVYEKSGNVGGAIRTSQKDGWLVEEGPNTLMVKSQEVWELLEELGLEDDIIEANSQAKRRFILKEGRPVALPSSPGRFLTTPLLSAGAKLRLLKEPFVAPAKGDDESIASFIQRRLGKQPLDYGVNPFVSGVYAGDPRKLSMKHTFSTLWKLEQQYGSLLKGAFQKERTGKSVRKALISFTNGNQVLPKTLAQTLTEPVQTSCEIRSARQHRGRWQISGRRAGQPFQTDHELLVLALPVHALPSIFASDHFNQLSDIPYVPLSVLALGFSKQQVEHPLNGFGMLIPKVEKRRALGMLFSSTLFPDRAPRGHHLITCFIGGARQPGLAHKSREELLELLLPELNELLGIREDPVFIHHTFWKRAIPQYEVGFDRHLATMDTIENTHPGLLLNGNYRHGVSVPDCISSGFATADRAARLLQSAGSQ